MRDEREEKKKQARSNKQGKATQHTQHVYYIIISRNLVVFIPQGMYAAADEILKTLLGKTLDEVRLEALRKLSGGEESGVSEKEVEKTYSRQRRLLREIFSKDEFKVRSVKTGQI